MIPDNVNTVCMSPLDKNTDYKYSALNFWHIHGLKYLRNYKTVLKVQ